MLKSPNPESPSHGRGHRFDPYGAHHISLIFRALLAAAFGSCRQYPAEQNKTRRGADVEKIPRSFSRARASKQGEG